MYKELDYSQAPMSHYFHRLRRSFAAVARRRRRRQCLTPSPLLYYWPTGQDARHDAVSLMHVLDDDTRAFRGDIAVRHDKPSARHVSSMAASRARLARAADISISAT